MAEYEQIQDGSPVSVTMDESVDPPEGGTVSDEQISEAVAAYLAANPLVDAIRAVVAHHVDDAAAFEAQWDAWSAIPAGLPMLTIYADGSAATWTRGASGNSWINETVITVADNLYRWVIAGATSDNSESIFVRVVATPNGVNFGLFTLALNPDQLAAIESLIGASLDAESDPPGPVAAAIQAASDALLDSEGAGTVATAIAAAVDDARPSAIVVGSGTHDVGSNVSVVWVIDSEDATLNLAADGLPLVTVLTGTNSGSAVVKKADGTTLATVTTPARVKRFANLDGADGWVVAENPT